MSGHRFVLGLFVAVGSTFVYGAPLDCLAEEAPPLEAVAIGRYAAAGESPADPFLDASPNADAMASYELARRGSPAGPCIIAEFDPRCRFNHAKPFSPPLVLQGDDALNYFDRPIERNIHQIWFGGLSRMIRTKPDAWQAVARDHNWTYRMWTEEDLPAFKEMMEPENFNVLSRLLVQQLWYAASDFVRAHILYRHGGIYVDADIAPPVYRGVRVDPARVFPMYNMAFMSERWCRNVGSNTALMVGNGFIMAGSGHPFFEQLLPALRRSVQESNVRGDFDAAFSTGPFFISRLLSGAVTVLPQRYMRELKMFSWDEDLASEPFRGRSFYY